MLGNLSPDVIITDLKMPKMDGYEFMAALKARPDTAHIPIVVISSNQKPENRLLKTAKHIIFKDIDIEVQLQRVLDNLFPERTADLAKSQ
jgi:CheY-like chemotaxis protein